MEKQTLNPGRSLLAVDNVQDLNDPVRHQQPLANEDKQEAKDEEDEASFSDSS